MKDALNLIFRDQSGKAPISMTFENVDPVFAEAPLYCESTQKFIKLHNDYWVFKMNQ